MERARQGADAVRMMSDTDQQRLMRFNREFEGGPQLYASHRLIGLAANVPLDYQLADDQLWTQIFGNTRLEGLGRYPTAFVNDYLRMRHLTQDQFNTQTQDELLHSLGLERRASAGGAGGSAGRRRRTSPTRHHR